MPAVVEMLFNHSAERKLSAARQALADAGFGHPHAAPARPHVSFLIWDALDPRSLVEKAEALAAKLEPVPVRLTQIGTFGDDPKVLYVAVEMSDALRRTYERIYDHLGQTQGDIWPIYLPQRWLPHCTLAAEIPAARVDEACAAVRSLELPLDAELTRLGLAEIQPRGFEQTFSIGKRS
jgi:2'-5' RNA ligase